MKTLDEFIKEIDASGELQEEFKNANDMDSVNAFLKKYGCAATADELAEYIKSQRGNNGGELSDDEVSAIASIISKTALSKSLLKIRFPK